MASTPLISKASTTIIYTCNDCFYKSDNQLKFDKHICYKKEINRAEYIAMHQKIDILSIENNHYINVINEQDTKITTLENIIKKFSNNPSIISNMSQKDVVSKSLQTDTIKSISIASQTSSQTSLQTSSQTSSQISKDIESIQADSFKSAKDSLQNTDKVSNTDVLSIKKPSQQRKDDNVLNQKQDTNSPKQEPLDQYDNKKNVFRTVRGIELRDPYTDEEFNNIVNTVDNKEIEHNADSYNMTLDECENRINTLMNSIKEQKQYASELRELRYIRLRMFKFLQLPQYTDFLKKHIENMRDIFSARMDNKKIPSIIKTRLLLPLELRLLEIKGYESIPIDTNEVSLLKTYLRYKWGFDKLLKPFDKERIINLYGCYNIALFNVADYIKIILPNKYGLNNLIYLDVPKSANEDPFSFYYLDKVNKANDGIDVRHWAIHNVKIQTPKNLNDW